MERGVTINTTLHENGMDQLIQLYFELGITYPDIVLLFNDKHGYVISESTFK